MTLPRAIRNRLAHVIMAGFHDPAARRTLETIACARGAAEAAGSSDSPRADEQHDASRAAGCPLDEPWGAHQAEVVARAEQARRALAGRPFDPGDPPLAIALDQARVLFDARLYFEVHELLEPHWAPAEGADREALQGLIQTAAALHHLDGGNVAGARSVLRDAIAKLHGRRLAGLALDGFAAALLPCLDAVTPAAAERGVHFDWASVPRFPARAA